MKKTILLFALVAGIFACTKKEDGAAASTGAKGQNGITLDSSANTDLVRKSMAAIASGDTATYRSTYSSDVVFHDNLDSMGIDGNMAMFKLFADKGIKIKLEVGPVWENQFDKPDEKGISNFVMGYTTFTFTRGDKSTKTVIFSVDAIKDGKQVEEWLVYDRSAIAEISK
jgi:hypothetical protein